MRRDAAGIALLLMLPIVLAVWLLTMSGSAAAPTVPTGASFSLTVGRYGSAQTATGVASKLLARETPAFTRVVDSGSSHEVVVGPFVSIDEAERTQRRLRVQGFGAALLVDESLRRAPAGARGAASRAIGIDPAAHVLLVGAAGRYSLVIELRDAPKLLATPHTAGTLIEVEAGPLKNPVASHLWNAPPGVELVNQIALESFERGGGQFMRVRLAFSTGAASHVRLSGTRVYIDFWAANSLAPAPVIQAATPRQAGAPRRAVAPAPQVRKAPVGMSVDEYRQTIGPAVERYQAMRPFVAAAVASPSADVVNALAGTIAELEQWMRTLEPPAQEAGAHAALVASVQDTLRLLRAATPLPLQSTAPQR